MQVNDDELRKGEKHKKVTYFVNSVNGGPNA